MAEYIYKDMLNEQGWGMTFNAKGRFPIIGSRIFNTLQDLTDYLNGANSTAIAGVVCSVVNDPTNNGANNGLYQIEFVHTDWTETFTRDGQTITNVVCYNSVVGSNLRAVKLVNANNQGGIEGGSVVDGFYATISSKEYFVYKSGNNYYYYDEQGQQQTYTYQGETVHTYIELILTNGDKVRINADELKGVTDTYVVNGEVRIDTTVTPNKAYLDLRYNTDPTANPAPISIEIPLSVVTYNTAEGTLNATIGFFNNDAVQIIKEYVDDKTTDTVITYDPQEHTINATTGVFNDTAMGVIKNYIDDQIPQQPDDTVVTYNTVEGTLNATQGLFNDTAVNVIKDYIDDFDCGSFDLNP